MPKITLLVRAGDTVVGPRELTRVDFVHCADVSDFLEELEGNWVAGFGMGLPEDAIAILDVDGVHGRLRLNAEARNSSWTQAANLAFQALSR